MSSEIRNYRMKARAERQEETRHRIAAATASLHEEIGPARTTIAEVARRAGVQRPTVYNNFPRERELFAACQAHFLAEHPRPDLSGPLGLRDSRRRLQMSLEAMYGWYRANRSMVSNVQRDRHLLPELDSLLADTGDRQLDQLAEELASGLGQRGRTRARARALVRLALDFPTWQRLSGEGLTDAEAARVMTQVVSRLDTRPRGT